MFEFKELGLCFVYVYSQFWEIGDNTFKLLHQAFLIILLKIFLPFLILIKNFFLDFSAVLTILLVNFGISFYYKKLILKKKWETEVNKFFYCKKFIFYKVAILKIDILLARKCP